MKILLIEDDEKISEAVCKILKDNGNETDAVYDGVEGLYYGLNGDYDAIILDIMLPKMDGVDVLKLLRTKNIPTPILMLTAKSSVNDKVEGLNLGADDYLAKPFSTDELLARLSAITRRGTTTKNKSINYGDFTVNKDKYVLEKETKSIGLNSKEMNVILFLIENQNQIVSKERFILKVWGYDSDVTENNVEAYISFVRKKLNYIKSNVKIKSLRGVGYRLEYNDD